MTSENRIAKQWCILNIIPLYRANQLCMNIEIDLSIVVLNSRTKEQYKTTTYRLSEAIYEYSAKISDLHISVESHKIVDF